MNLTRTTTMLCVLALSTSGALAGPRGKTARPEEAATPSKASVAPDPTRPPPPEKRRMVGILDVRVEGVPDEIKAAFERGLEEQLDTKIYWLSSRAQMRDRMKFSTKWVEGCLVGPCLAELRTQTNAELVLLAAFNGSGTSFGHVVTLVRTDTGRVLSQESGRCDVCTVNEAMAEATLATMRLLANVPDKLPDEAGDQSAAIELAVGAEHKKLAVAERATRRRGLVLTLVGLAVTGAGIATYVANDKPDYALAIAAGGAGMTLGGVVVLTF